VPALAEDAESFIARLEQRWAVILPDDRVRIVLAVGNPEDVGAAHLPGAPWLGAGYDEAYQRIEIRVDGLVDYEHAAVARELRHQLVHALTQSERGNRLPGFVEEGMASYYAGLTGGNDRYVTILALLFHEDLAAWLEESAQGTHGRSGLRILSAVGRQYVEWLWDRRPGAEQLFMQSFLQGKSYRSSLIVAGLPPAETLMYDFEAQIRPRNRWYHLPRTPDFWVILLGGGFLIYFVFRIVRAIQVARTPFVEIAVAETASVPAEQLFTGPAFQAPRESPEPDVPDAPDEPVEAEENPFARIDDDLDSVFGDLGTKRDPQNVFEDVDDELEDAFSFIEKKPDKKKKEVDEEVDRIFGDWDVM